MNEKFIIGIVGAPFGVKGFVKVRSCSGEIEHILKLKSVIISKDGKERIINIDESSPANVVSTVLIHFEGINNPEIAKTLNGAQLLVGRDEAAPLFKGEFYIEDLKGLEVYGEEEYFQIIGVIIDIIEGGGGELVEIKLTNGEKRLVPLRKEFFPEISPDKGSVLLQNLWILE
ncbi:MAG: ribosome maturation factor RimM [Treponema sp.]|nr:ribosome maturation factor RimM [Treponema sp.]